MREVSARGFYFRLIITLLSTATLTSKFGFIIVGVCPLFSGGLKLTVTGKNFDSIQSPEIFFTNPAILNSSKATEVSPGEPKGKRLGFSVVKASSH